MKITRQNHRAFTLIEIMVAIAIFSMVVAAIYSVWMAVVRAARVARDVAAQAQRERVTLHTFQDAIDGIQSFQASPQYYSFVIENNNDTATLSFTSRLPEQMFPRNGKFINPNNGNSFVLRRLIFTVEQDKYGENSLMLRQYPVLMDIDDDEQKFPLELAKNVRQFNVECWGTNEQTGAVGWLKEWDNTNAIPDMLRVNLVVGGNVSGGKSAPDVNLVRVYSVPSQMMPAVIQKGGLAGAPTPGGNSGIRIPTPTANQ